MADDIVKMAAREAAEQILHLAPFLDYQNKRDEILDKFQTYIVGALRKALAESPTAETAVPVETDPPYPLGDLPTDKQTWLDVTYNTITNDLAFNKMTADGLRQALSILADNVEHRAREEGLRANRGIDG